MKWILSCVICSHGQFLNEENLPKKCADFFPLTLRIVLHFRPCGQNSVWNVSEIGHSYLRSSYNILRIVGLLLLLVFFFCFSISRQFCAFISHNPKWDTNNRSIMKTYSNDKNTKMMHDCWLYFFLFFFFFFCFLKNMTQRFTPTLFVSGLKWFVHKYRQTQDIVKCKRIHITNK